MKTRIGSRLLAIRQERGLTQADIAEVLGMPESSYARYERNETQIDYTKLVAFAEKLNVPVYDLLPETVSINNHNNNSGQGGGVIFGNQYFYFGENMANQAMLQENQVLKERIALLEMKIQAFLDKKI